MVFANIEYTIITELGGLFMKKCMGLFSCQFLLLINAANATGLSMETLIECPRVSISAEEASMISKRWSGHEKEAESLLNEAYSKKACLEYMQEHDCRGCFNGNNSTVTTYLAPFRQLPIILTFEDFKKAIGIKDPSFGMLTLQFILRQIGWL